MFFCFMAPKLHIILIYSITSAKKMPVEVIFFSFHFSIYTFITTFAPAFARVMANEAKLINFI